VDVVIALAAISNDPAGQLDPSWTVEGRVQLVDATPAC
jgi:hypothetical protein